MKLFNAITTTIVIGASIISTAIPVSAQYYGAYGNRNNPYDRHRRNYDVNPHNRNAHNLYSIPRRNPAPQTINSYARKNDIGSRYIR